MSQVTITLPDGSSRVVPSGTLVRDVAAEISPRLAKAALAAEGRWPPGGPVVSAAGRTRASGSSPATVQRRLRCTRASTAHLLAAAVTNLFPGVQYGIGPATEEGFFYDFVVPRPFVPEDLEAIEKKMRDLAQQDLPSRAAAVAARRSQAITRRARRAAQGSTDRGGAGGSAEVVAYTIKDRDTFVDFCVGPHVPSTGKLKAFKLLSTSIAGERFVDAAKVLQDVLGEHQDAFVAEEHIRAWAEGKPEAGDAVRKLLKRERARRRKARGRVAASLEAPRAPGAQGTSVIRAAGGVVTRRRRRPASRCSWFTGRSTATGRCRRERRCGASATRRVPLREVEEETGLRCELGEELATTRYRDIRGRAKRVRYWLMTPIAGELEFRNEVDDGRWLSRRGGARLLSYARDVEVLGSLEARRGPPPDVTPRLEPCLPSRARHGSLSRATCDRGAARLGALAR